MTTLITAWLLVLVFVLALLVRYVLDNHPCIVGRHDWTAWERHHFDGGDTQHCRRCGVEESRSLYD